MEVLSHAYSCFVAFTKIFGLLTERKWAWSFLFESLHLPIFFPKRGFMQTLHFAAFHHKNLKFSTTNASKFKLKFILRAQSGNLRQIYIIILYRGKLYKSLWWKALQIHRKVSPNPKFMLPEAASSMTFWLPTGML